MEEPGTGSGSGLPGTGTGAGPTIPKKNLRTGTESTVVKYPVLPHEFAHRIVKNIKRRSGFKGTITRLAKEVIELKKDINSYGYHDVALEEIEKIVNIMETAYANFLNFSKVIQEDMVYLNDPRIQVELHNFSADSILNMKYIDHIVETRDKIDLELKSLRRFDVSKGVVVNEEGEINDRSLAVGFTTSSEEVDGLRLSCPPIAQNQAPPPALSVISSAARNKIDLANLGTWPNRVVVDSSLKDASNFSSEQSQTLSSTTSTNLSRSVPPNAVEKVQNHSPILQEQSQKRRLVFDARRILEKNSSFYPSAIPIETDLSIDFAEPCKASASPPAKLPCFSWPVSEQMNVSERCPDTMKPPVVSYELSPRAPTPIASHSDLMVKLEIVESDEESRPLSLDDITQTKLKDLIVSPKPVCRRIRRQTSFNITLDRNSPCLSSSSLVSSTLSQSAEINYDLFSYLEKSESDASELSKSTTSLASSSNQYDTSGFEYTEPTAYSNSRAEAAIPTSFSIVDNSMNVAYESMLSEQMKDKNIITSDSDNSQLCYDGRSSVHPILIAGSDDDEEFNNDGFPSRHGKHFLESAANICPSNYRTDIYPTCFATQVTSAESFGNMSFSFSPPTFSGARKDWKAFQDSFISTVHKNSNFGDGLKLHYLKKALKGNSSQLLKNLPTQDSNYALAWKVLCNHYLDPRTIVRTNIANLINCTPRKFKPHEYLEQLIKEHQEFLENLAASGVKMGNDKSLGQQMALELLRYKLDPATKQLWEDATNGRKLQNHSQLVQFINTRIQTLRQKLPFIPEPQSVQQIAGQTNQPQFTNSNQSNFDLNYPQNSLDQLNVPICLVCKEIWHPLFTCKVFKQKRPSERHQIVRNIRCCYNCLGTNHPVEKCNSSAVCKECKARHHTLLHFNGNFEINFMQTNVSDHKPDNLKKPPLYSVVNCCLFESEVNLLIAPETSCSCEIGSMSDGSLPSECGSVPVASNDVFKNLSEESFCVTTAGLTPVSVAVCTAESVSVFEDVLGAAAKVASGCAVESGDIADVEGLLTDADCAVVDFVCLPMTEAERVFSSKLKDSLVEVEFETGLQVKLTKSEKPTVFGERDDIVNGCCLPKPLDWYSQTTRRQTNANSVNSSLAVQLEERLISGYTATHRLISCKQTTSVLPTATLDVFNKSGQTFCLRALLDTGCQTNLVSIKSVNKLNLTATKGNFEIQPLGKPAATCTDCFLNLRVKVKNVEKPFEIMCIVLKDISLVLPKQEFVVPELQHISRDTFADKNLDKPACIDIVIGIETYNEILINERCQSGKLFFQRTIFGWSASGNAELKNSGCRRRFESLSDQNTDRSLIV